MTAPIDAFNDWYRKFWGGAAPAPDGAAILALKLAAPFVARGVVANVKVPSDRALALADAMVDFLQPGLPGATFGEYWLGALMDVAGIDPDAEWLVALNKHAARRNWDAALAAVKGRASGTPAPRGDITLSGFLLPILGAEAVSKLRVAMSA